jgi:hypothetical protein
MSEQSDNLQGVVLTEMSRLVAPLQSLDSADAVFALLHSLGWDAPEDGVTAIQGVLVPVVTAVKSVLDAANRLTLDTSLATLAEVAIDLPRDFKAVYDAVLRVKDTAPQSVDFISQSGIADGQELFLRLNDYLIATYLRRYRLKLYASLTLFGLIRYTRPSLPLASFHSYQGYLVIEWEKITQLFNDPIKHFAEVYRWGLDDFSDPQNPTGGFDSQRLLDNLLLFMRAFSISGGRYLATDNTPELRYPLYKAGIWDIATGSGSYQELGLAMRALAAQYPGKAGLFVKTYALGGVTTNFDLGTDWKATIGGALSGFDLGLKLRPGEQPQLTAQTGQGAANLDLICASEMYLMGKEMSTLSLRLKGLKFSLNLIPTTDDWIEFELDIDSVKLAILPSSIDGFLRKLLPAEGIQFEFALALLMSKNKAPRFKGAAGFEFQHSLNITILDTIYIETVFIALKFSTIGQNSILNALLATSIKAKLGPITALVEKIGLTFGLTFPREHNPEFAIGFKPPDGLGFTIDASTVVGGGYLFFDNDKGQYGGVLQLEVKGGIAIKAIGLITTKMPDGSPGFSLLIIITVEFSPIQLGYGFTLNGVGGLAGFNRTMKLDTLRDGIKNRTLDSIMFPPDPIANAQKIISDLQTVFPPAPGRFVFAPMAKLGWGSSILIIEIGLAVELPAPLRLAVMGKLHLRLPPLQQAGDDQESKTVVEIHMDVLGTLDFDKSEASVDAILYNSRIALFPITGGMAMRLRWGNDPVFAIAIGGFNPRFTPPPGFPAVGRLAMQLSYEGNGLRAFLRLESYLAVTANTLQFGARIDAYAEVSGAKVAGYLGFDALIEFHPFYFIVDMYGGVVVQAFDLSFNVELFLTLSGPRPLLGDGHVTVNFLGKHEFPIQFAIGEATTTPALPPVDPLQELEAALSDLRNWSATLPADRSMLVTLRQLSTAETNGKVLAHPLGELTVRQKVLPFGITLQRFGASVPTTPGPFDLSRFKLGANQFVQFKPEFMVRDAFARGQFVNLTEDEKLSSPGFEFFRCGQTHIGTDTITYEEASKQEASFEYDITVIDNEREKRKRPSKKVSVSDEDFLRAAQFGAAKQTPMNSMGSAKFTGSVQGIKVQEPTYVVAGTDDLQMRGTNKFETYTEAEEARRAAGPGESQVVEAYEIA